MRPTARLNAGLARLVRSLCLVSLPYHTSWPHDCQQLIVCSETKMSSYRARIVEAIANLKARSPGSTALAIKRCVRANMPADEEWTNSVFLNALKKMVADGDLVQTDDNYMFSQKFLEKSIQKKSASADTDTAAVSSSSRWVLKRTIDE